ncbi:MAG: YHYH protein [Rhodospirillales bacterium]
MKSSGYKAWAGAAVFTASIALFAQAGLQAFFGLPDNKVSVRTDSDYRYITSNAIPDHSPGNFPNRRNPNAIAEQSLSFRVPLRPELTGRLTSVGMNVFAIATNGVPFDPSAAEWWQRDRNSGWQYEPLSPSIDLGLDKHNAHVQPNGTYHYHGIPTGLVEDVTPDRHSKLIAYAADGFPVYLRYGYSDPKDPSSPVADLTPSWRVKQGSRPGGPGGRYDGSFIEDYEYVAGLGTLDECSGRQTVTPDFPNGTYAYYLTRDWPVIPRCLKGERDRSFVKMGPGGTARGSGERQPGGGGGGRPGGPPDFNKAGEMLGIDGETLRRALGPPPPDFDSAAQKLGIPVERLHEAMRAAGGGRRP